MGLLVTKVLDSLVAFNYCPAALGCCQSFFEKSKNIVISNSTFTNVKKYPVIELE
jgi:hypothetical protein